MDFTGLITDSADIRGVIFAYLDPVHKMTLCLVSKATHGVSWSVDLKCRRFNEEIARSLHDHELQQTLTMKNLHSRVVGIAASVGNTDLLGRWSAENPDSYLYDKLVSRAIMHRQLPALKLLYGKFGGISKRVAAKCAELDVIEMVQITLEMVPFVASKLTKAAFAAQNLPVVKYLHDKGLLTSLNGLSVASMTDLEFIKYIVGIFPAVKSDIHHNAAERGRIYIMDWLFDIGYRHTVVNIRTCVVAKWYYLKGYAIRDFYSLVLKCNDTVENIRECIKWAVSERISMNKYEVRDIIVRFGIQWIIDNNIVPLDTNLSDLVVDLDSLKILHQHGCPWDIRRGIDWVINNSICIGSFASSHDILDWMLETGVELTPDLYRYTYDRSNYARCNDIVDKLHKYGCPLTADVFVDAISTIYVSTTIINQLIEIGCHWDSRVCFLADNNGSYDIIDLIHRAGCPCCSTCDYWIHNKRS